MITLFGVVVLFTATNRRSSSTDSRLKSDSRVDVTSQGIPHDVVMTSSPMSSSMPHLGPHDKPDTIQPLKYIYRSSSAALTGCHGDVDDDNVSMATTKRWAGRHEVMTSRDSAVEKCYWSRRRQSFSAGSNSRFHLSLLPPANAAW